MELFYQVRKCFNICGILILTLELVYGQKSTPPYPSTLDTSGVSSSEVTIQVSDATGGTTEAPASFTDGLNITDNQSLTTHFLPITGGITDTPELFTDGLEVTDNKTSTSHVLQTTTMLEGDQPNYLFSIGVPLASSIVLFLALTICVCLLSIAFDMRKKRDLMQYLTTVWDDQETYSITNVEEGVFTEDFTQGSDFDVSPGPSRRSDIRSAYFNQSSYRRGSELETHI